MTSLPAASARILGLPNSPLVRRTLPSIGLAAALFVLVRALIAGLARPYNQPPIRASGAPHATNTPTAPTGALQIDDGYLTATGETIDYPQARAKTASERGYTACLRDNGIVRSYIDFQPPDHLATFQLIEFGVFTLLAAALAVVTWRLMRRTTRL